MGPWSGCGPVTRGHVTELITTRTIQLGLSTLEDTAATQPRASLVFQLGDSAEVVQLQGHGDTAVVGRVAPSDVQLPGSTLSRQHARFTLETGTLSVEDLDSLNGTWVNEERVARAKLARGDLVQLGDVVVHVSLSLPHPELHADPTASVVQGAAMRGLYARIDKLAQIDVSVLIEGETGTGKELCARALHERGPRRDQPLSVLNCGAIPEHLAESALFGHERGAFTGANARSPGIFEQAGEGTVFLDEVGELPYPTQAKLLRVLETRRVTRLGAERDIPVPVRVISATHCNLEAMAAEGSFRRDLLYRLNAVTLRVPPLRERPEEIGPLANHFRLRAEQEWSLPPALFEPDALAAMMAFTWPGNVRQLRNVVERGLLLCRDGRVRISDLPDSIAGTTQTAQGVNVGAEGGLHDATSALGESSRAATDEPSSESLRAQVDALEARLIRDALANTMGNQRAAAKLLRVPRRTLAYKIQRLGIDPSEPE